MPLIVIEGTDGSGKATQVKLLKKRIRAKKIPLKYFSFPRYKKKEGERIAKYLKGELGDPQKISPYYISPLYTVDRAAARDEVRFCAIINLNGEKCQMIKIKN